MSFSGRSDLAVAARSGQTVTVLDLDGRARTGTIHAHPTDPDLFTVHTGRRGRPASIHPDDVDYVVFES